jgi:hypothetical protein
MPIYWQITKEFLMSFKKLTSLTLAFSFLTMSFTGIMLYIVPQGKVAYWADWKMFGLTKGEYGDLHITSMVLFVLFAFIHIYYNWKPLMSYLKDSSKKFSLTKREFLVALALNLLFIAGVFYSLQPVKSILDINSDIKEYWVDVYGLPPYGHAEESTLKKFCKKTNIELQQAKENLTKNKIAFTMEESLKEIAKNNGVSPQHLYDIMDPID